MSGNTWNDGHFDSIGKSILGLTIVLLIASFVLWPLALPKRAKGRGGCCNAYETELNNDR